MHHVTLRSRGRWRLHRRLARLAAAPAEREEKDGGRSAAPNISIALKPAAANSAWSKRLQATEPKSWHAVYLDERRDNAMSVGFFLDSAEFFLQKGQRELGLRALSNLAELDLQNRQVLRLLAYRLQQADEVALALPIFERVLELAPNEPQSHRDLGLALAKSGQSQRAVDRLYEVVTGAWDSRFADADLIALAELNAVVAEAERAGEPVDVSAIEPRLLKNLPLDVRVVLAWDADATDVDLHVIDPNGEEVFYGRNLSYQGGAITRDATGGYGPEEFALRNAKPGKYRVEANFFGHRQQVLASSTGFDALVVERLRDARAAGPAHDAAPEKRGWPARCRRRVRGQTLTLAPLALCGRRLLAVRRVAATVRLRERGRR